MVGIVLSADSLGLPVKIAPQLAERYDRLMQAIENEHPGDIVDEAKAFLECIFRTIITNRAGVVDEGRRGHASFMSLYDQAWEHINFPGNEFGMASALRLIVEMIGNVRNNYGSVSHGQDGYDDRSIGLNEALFIGRGALSLAAYFYSHHISVSKTEENERINYLDNPDFNDMLDSAGDVVIAGIVMLQSEILFNNDPAAYREQLLEFRQDSDIAEGEEI